MLPVMPTTSGANRRPPGRGDGVERAQGVGHADDRDVAELVEAGSPAAGSGSRVTSSAAAPASDGAGAGTGGRRCARRAGRRTACRARPAGSRRRRRGRGRSARRTRVPPVAATSSSAVSAGSGSGVPSGVGHAGECRIGHARAGHRTPGAACVSGTRSGVVIASWAIRRNSSNDITGISRWPSRTTVGVPSSIRTATTRSGRPGWRAT